jgi:2-keto-3-deoxy-6-phosphogluconate aldolase
MQEALTKLRMLRKVLVRACVAGSVSAGEDFAAAHVAGARVTIMPALSKKEVA